jgi:hypothetical protein
MKKKLLLLICVTMCFEKAQSQIVVSDSPKIQIASPGRRIQRRIVKELFAVETFVSLASQGMRWTFPGLVSITCGTGKRMV